MKIKHEDKIVESVLNSFLKRSEIGKQKYNTNLNRTDLSLLEWLEHAQEEAQDFILYLEKIKQTVKELELNI